MAIVMMPMPIHAQEVPETPVTCSLSASEYDPANPNRFEFTVSLTGAPWSHLSWFGDGGGVDAQDGETKPVYFSYDKPDRWIQTVSMTVNGIECATKTVNIDAWEPVESPDPGESGAVPGTPAVVVPSVPAEFGSKSWQCVQMDVKPDKNQINKLNIEMVLQGQLSELPVKVFFGDGSYTYPPRVGGIVKTDHSYDIEDLKAGVTISADLSQLGDNATCLFTTYTLGGIESFASNSGGSFVN
jgi:hypothetical protein